jgi:hypothetical protein
MRLIQISAWNDSGGGLLHRLFDGHPGLNVWPFELLLGSDAGRWDAFTPDWFHGRYRWPRLEAPLARGDGGAAFDAISDLELKSVLTDPARGKHAGFPVAVSLAEWRRDTVAQWQASGDKSQRSFLVAYLSAFLRLRGLDPDARPLLGHCPVAVLDAEELFADFPDARLLHVVRNPLSGFHAMRSRHPALEPRRYAEKWSLVNMAAALWLGKRPERLSIVALNALISDRRAAMERMCGWLGLPFDELALTPSWGGRSLPEGDLGPFGGVRTPTAAAEQTAAQAIDAKERDALLLGTAATVAVLDRLGVAEARAWLA